METRHRIVGGDAGEMAALPDDSVELVVTSPPYPMVEMWDDLFAERRPETADLLASGEGAAAFELMHRDLDAVWAEVARVLVDGGIACVNVGDATRRVDGEFRLFRNADRIAEAFEGVGLSPLPGVLWRKPANSAAKFMGSGMLPSNAYVTQEHEHVLLFRNGGTRSFPPGADERYEAAFFWEERNRWFSDLWTDVGGDGQALDDGPRERTAAFPVEIPYRLIAMFSVYGDTVLDPFWGTGTTTLAAMAAGRNSVGYELEPDLIDAFDQRVEEAPSLAAELVRGRLADHRAFVERRRDDGDPPGYEAEHYDFPVVTDQERRIRLYTIRRIEATDEGYRAVHEAA
ncbi:MAG: site-specific DNA-methyltransferase [Haloferacaceae archaeon]